MHISTPADKILVTIDKKTQDEITLSGGFKLWQETRLNMEEHVTVCGTVVGIPGYLKRDDLEVIKPIVQEGDEVYFSYAAIFDQHLTEDIRYHVNELEIDEKSYWIVDYCCVFFIKKGEEITMVGGNVLCEPVYEKVEWPSYLVQPAPVMKKDRGIVVAICEPNIGEPEIGVKKGELVAFDEKYVETYNFWGKKYFITNQGRILHKICKSTQSTIG